MSVQLQPSASPSQNPWPDAPREFGRGDVTRWMRPVEECIKADTSLSEAIHQMVSSEVDHLIVTDDKGNLVGIVGYRALIELVANGRYEGPATVNELIEAYPATVDSDAPFHAALRLLDPPDVTCVVVVERGRPIGVVSERHLAMPSLAIVASSL